MQEEMQLKAEAEATARAAEARALETEEEKLITEENSTREINQLNRDLARLRRDSEYSLIRLRREVSGYICSVILSNYKAVQIAKLHVCLKGDSRNSVSSSPLQEDDATLVEYIVDWKGEYFET